VSTEFSDGLLLDALFPIRVSCCCTEHRKGGGVKGLCAQIFQICSNVQICLDREKKIVIFLLLKGKVPGLVL